MSSAAFRPSVGAQALALIGLCNTIGTYIFGLLGARYSQKRLLAMIYGLRTCFIAMFLLVPVTATSTLVFAAAMGFLWLGVAPLVTGVVSRVFGFEHFNALYGAVFLSHQLGSFAGAWMGGMVFSFTGSYTLRVGRAARDRRHRLHAAVDDGRPPASGFSPAEFQRQDVEDSSAKRRWVSAAGKAAAGLLTSPPSKNNRSERQTMTAGTVSRVLSLIPERTVRMQSGVNFDPQARAVRPSRSASPTW